MEVFMVVGKRRPAEFPVCVLEGVHLRSHLNPGAEAAQRGQGSTSMYRDRPSGQTCRQGWV